MKERLNQEELEEENGLPLPTIMILDLICQNP